MDNTQRAKTEETQHDQWAKNCKIDDLLVKESFEAPTAIENHYALEVFKDLKGKTVLDLGCGAGEASVYFAGLGAKVSAADISSEYLSLAEKLAQKFNVKINTFKLKAEALDFNDASFDFVYGFGVLHHVEMIPAIKEVHRVLSRNGIAIFIEPLSYNPLINIYRVLANKVRTPDEKPLNLKDIKSIKQIFPKMEHQEFQLFTLLIFIYFFLVKFSNPSKERYWKKILAEGNKYKTAFKVLNAIDNLVLRIFPFLRPFCWTTVLVLKK
jgi:2-polyprenyl-3-methyl-5-hydroxy-6-metoxy-1,4-benzoquinol methylase